MRAFAEMLLVRVAVLSVACAAIMGTMGLCAAGSPDRGRVAVIVEDTTVPPQRVLPADPAGHGALPYLEYLRRHLGLQTTMHAATVLSNGRQACAYMAAGHTPGQTAAWMLAVTHVSDWDSPFTVAQSYGARRYLCP